MGEVIEPKFFKMRTKDELSLLKRIIWITFGRKTFGFDGDYYCEGYWLLGICYITKCEVKNGD